MMKLGMICNDPTEEKLDFVKSLDLEFIEGCCNSGRDITRFLDNFEEKLKLVKEKGLYYGSIGRWNPTAQVDGVINEDEYKLVESLLDAAIKSDTPNFVTGLNYDESATMYRNYTNAIEFLGRLCERAKGTNTVVSVCNCDWNNFIVDSFAWNIVLGELPDLMIKFDASHSYAAGRNYLKEISEWGDRIAHVHLKGRVVTDGNRISDPPAGLDDLKWPSIFAALYHFDYDRLLSIEPHSGPWFIESERGKAGVKFTVDFARQFIF